ncbi:MAG: hypothetical protein ABL995_13470 [Bryobacteraceae bacterium]
MPNSSRIPWLCRNCLVLAWLLGIPAFAADWVEYRSGPFHVFSNAGDRKGREALTELEQLRFVLGGLIGKPELATVWPINIVLFQNQKEYAPHVLPSPLIDGSGSTLAAWTADASKTEPLPRDLIRSIILLFFRDNAGRMAPGIETGLADLFSTIEVEATRVRLGAPLPAGELSGARLRTWTKLQMLTTQPEYAGKLRVYINNLQQAGGEDVAVRNAYDTTPAKLEEKVDAYAKAGRFESAPVIGRAINPNRDYIEREVTKATMDGLIAELDAKGKNFPPDSPRGLLAKNTLSSLELAIRANPKWAEPQFKIAELETDPARKIARLKMAASLDPRNTGYWQTLAEVQTKAELYADAEKSWTAAERAAESPEERDRIHKAKLDLEDQRAAAEMAARQRARDEEARELQALKDKAAAEVRAAESAANTRLGANAGNIQGAVPWYGDVTGLPVSGTLTRIDCLNPSMRLTVQTATGPAVRLMIRDPQKIAVASESGQARFDCGLQKPVRKIEVQHDGKADAKLGTAGDILVVKFP